MVCVLVMISVPVFLGYCLVFPIIDKKMSVKLVWSAISVGRAVY